MYNNHLFIIFYRYIETYMTYFNYNQIKNKILSL